MSAVRALGPASATPVAQTEGGNSTDAKADGADGGAADAEQEKPAKTTEVRAARRLNHWAHRSARPRCARSSMARRSSEVRPAG